MTASIECSSHTSSTQSWCNVHTLDCNVYSHSWLSHSPGNSCTVTVLLIKVSISSSSVTEGNKTCQWQENKMLPGRRGEAPRRRSKKLMREKIKETETHSLWSGCGWRSAWSSACACIRWARGGSSEASLCSSPPRSAPSPAFEAAPEHDKEHAKNK